ncbi:MAG: hypothetical protein JWO47_117 [Candidatus Saccharibacteria bacterium]|nr:hypothetical protein [Candidatus Saccharibacteria bacterium]
MEPQKQSFDVQPPSHPSPHSGQPVRTQQHPQQPQHQQGQQHPQNRPTQQHQQIRPTQQHQPQQIHHNQHPAQQIQKSQHVPHNPGPLNMQAAYQTPAHIAQQQAQQAQEKAAQQPAQEVKKAKNPARKWLQISAGGLAICALALGIHFLAGGGGNPNPLPKKVLAQVFGFTPYYFNKDTPPDHLKLDLASPKFIGNALNFTMLDPKSEKITVTQTTLPASGFKKLAGDTAATPLGEATIKVGGGHIEAELVTPDKTLVTLKATDFVSSGTLIDILGNMKAAPKGAAALQQQ